MSHLRGGMLVLAILIFGLASDKLAAQQMGISCNFEDQDTVCDVRPGSAKPVRNVTVKIDGKPAGHVAYEPLSRVPARRHGIF